MRKYFIENLFSKKISILPQMSEKCDSAPILCVEKCSIVKQTCAEKM